MKLDEYKSYDQETLNKTRLVQTLFEGEEPTLNPAEKSKYQSQLEENEFLRRQIAQINQKYKEDTQNLLKDIKQLNQLSDDKEKSLQEMKAAIEKKDWLIKQLLEQKQEKENLKDIMSTSFS